MKKNTNRTKPNLEKFIVTEGIDYFKTGNRPIWGEGDQATIQFLKKTKLKGRWLNLAAGDGRYCDILLPKIDAMVAADFDKGALSKLWYFLPNSLQKKVELKVFNMTKSFPFSDGEFDGIFCVGTLHLFPPSILKKIIYECDRVLKKNGKIVIDFATDVKRVYPDGTLKPEPKNRPAYRLDEAIKLVKSYFKKYKVSLIRSEVSEERVADENTGLNFGYTFHCRFFLLYGKKKK